MNTEAIPPIISEEIFEKCQKRLSSNKHKAASFKKVEERYYLTGKIFCGECGTSMSGISGTSKTKDNYRYYQCMKSKKKTCKKKIVQKALIEDRVFDSIMQLLKNKNLVKKISERCYSMQSAESSQVPILKKQLKAVEKEIDNVMNAIKAGIITKSTKQTLTELEEKQATIEAALAQEQICRPILSREQIEFWIMQFAKTDFKDEEQKQRLIDIFINSVFVYEDRLVVFLNFKEGEVALSLDDVNEGIKKENTQANLECSSLLMIGDPYGSRTHDFTVKG
ncbi:MAG: recombinase zinc beta ribbon domain-containing protein [Oscillospiraceae bacterium]|nr:recombinase zinc beta ribbon domain-containing protein [Oscillospiraceae bacterium]